VSQPEYLRVKGSPSMTWKEELRNSGLARATAAKAETAATEYFILNLLKDEEEQI
jgi:hypothetical protein